MSSTQAEQKNAKEQSQRGMSMVIDLPSPTPVPAAQNHLQEASSSPSKFIFPSLDLSEIRDTLIRLEESIIFALIERAQFKLNAKIYRSDALQIAPGQSVLSYFLLETEQLHARVRRYTSPCEHPFNPPSLLPQPLLPELSYPNTIKPNQINHNEKVMRFYLGTVLPSICAPGDDENYGSSATCDVNCLQLLSKRIHYGKFVAESKFRSDTDAFTRAIREKDVATLTSFITKPTVEEQVLVRVRLKAATYGRAPVASTQPSPLLSATPAPTTPSDGTAASTLSLPPTSTVSGVAIQAQPQTQSAANSSETMKTNSGGYKVAPEVIAQLYETIMTLNKEVQIAYLLQRLDA